jgi:DNA-binding MarR family transcriptional regulator
MAPGAHVPEDKAQYMLDLLLRFNRKVEEVAKRRQAPLYITVNYLLNAIAQQRDLGVTELSQALVLDKSSLSRLVNSSEKLGLLELVPHPSDARRKTIQITERGAKAVAEDNNCRNEHVTACLDGLDEDQQDTLANRLSLLADGMGAEPLEKVSHEHPVRVPLRRLTRVMGMLGDDFLGSGMAVEQFQILQILSEHQNAISMRDLGNRLPYTQSSLSRLTESLNRKNWVTKVPSPDDGRQLMVGLSLQGRHDFLEIKNRAVDLLRDAVRKLGGTFDELTSLLEAFLGHPERTLSALGTEVRQLRDPQELGAARALVIEELVRAQRQHLAGESLLASRNLVLGAFISDRLVGVLELERRKRIWVAVNFSVRPEFHNSRLIAEVWLEAARMASSVTHADAILALPSESDPSIAALLEHGRKVKQGLVEFRAPELERLAAA